MRLAGTEQRVSCLGSMAHCVPECRRRSFRAGQGNEPQRALADIDMTVALGKVCVGGRWSTSLLPGPSAVTRPTALSPLPLWKLTDKADPVTMDLHDYVSIYSLKPSACGVSVCVPCALVIHYLKTVLRCFLAVQWLGP